MGNQTKSRSSRRFTPGTPPKTEVTDDTAKTEVTATEGDEQAVPQETTKTDIDVSQTDNEVVTETDEAPVESENEAVETEELTTEDMRGSVKQLEDEALNMELDKPTNGQLDADAAAEAVISNGVKPAPPYIVGLDRIESICNTIVAMFREDYDRSSSDNMFRHYTKMVELTEMLLRDPTFVKFDYVYAWCLEQEFLETKDGSKITGPTHSANIHRGSDLLPLNKKEKTSMMFELIFKLRDARRIKGKPNDKGFNYSVSVITSIVGEEFVKWVDSKYSK